MITYVLQDAVRTGAIDLYVTGPYRHLYFKRPIVPVLQPPQVIMQIPEERKAVVTGPPAPVEVTRTIGIQTDYRESEAQTDPITPAHTVEEGHDPEVLYFTYLTYGNGLPASMAEMELIEQAREKKLFEQMLPASTDEACFLLRRKLMEEQEFKEWNKRESDIMRIQAERLKLLQTALYEREKENEDRSSQRIEDIRLKRTEHKDRNLAKIGRKRIKVLRKMYKERLKAGKIEIKRDIIEEYASFGSTVYAGITREGMSLDKLANKYEVQPEMLTTYQGIKELTYTLPQKVLETRIDLVDEQKKLAKHKTRKELSHKAALVKAQRALDLIYNPPSDRDDQRAQGRYSMSEFIPRPATPRMERPVTEEVEKRTISILLLQRLLRGRAIQNAMYDGKEKRLNLIAELRGAGEAIDLTESQQEQELLKAYQERVMDGTAESLQGAVISEAFCNLSKELVRLRQEQKIAVMVKFAERQRREKECEESGRRQAEELLRSREDALFRQIMEVNQTTVDSYLRSIITGSVGEASMQQALEEAHLRAYQLNEIIDNLEERMNKPELVVKDLVAGFLIPEVQRQKLQRQIKWEEKRHLVAARKILEETARATKKAYSSSRADQAIRDFKP
mmetsp:Transcript_32152/g.55526  ORF Transcript_32152/g.55526 Transcript_32152/m.55526 type:complete len:621 (-) Transcript_32152:18-1880(-)